MASLSISKVSTTDRAGTTAATVVEVEDGDPPISSMDDAGVMQTL